VWVADHSLTHEQQVTFGRAVGETLDLPPF
jgi:hypothetical protein